MFAHRDLSTDLIGVRDEHAPGAVVLDTERDFETLQPAVAENLLPIVDRLELLDYDGSWVPPGSPDVLHRLVSDEFTIGAPGDGGVAWTRQTVPPTVFVKPRLKGSPAGFVDFLIAEALVEVGLGVPEHFLGFFTDSYPHFVDAVPLSPSDTYQVAAAIFRAHVGLSTREVFADWDGTNPDLYEEWLDAGERLGPRLGSLSDDVTSGRTRFADAAELACNAVKHDLEIPSPFSALDSDAYREHGARFAVSWAEEVFEDVGG